MAYGLLGLVIERVSNEKLEDYIQHKILTPLHMTNTFLTKPTNDKIGFFTNGNSWWSTDLGFAAAYVHSRFHMLKSVKHEKDAR